MRGADTVQVVALYRTSNRMPPGWGWLASLLVLAVVLLGGCSAEPVVPESNSSDGQDPAIRAAPGESRAGRIRPGTEGAGAVFGGIGSEARAGDVKIYNSRVQFVIQDARDGHGYVPRGGNIIDADLVRSPETLGRDTIDDLFLSFGIARLFAADEVSIVADGSEGGPAIVRARGRDVPWEFIQGATESEEPLLADQNLDITTDYELGANSLSLRITTTFTNTGDVPSRFNPTEGFLASAEDLWPWASGKGLVGPGSGDLDALGAVGQWGEGTLSIWSQEGTLRLLGITSIVSSAGLVAATHSWVDLEPGASVVLSRNLTIAPDPLMAEAERLRGQGLPLVEVEGTVLDESSGEPVEAVRVHFVEADSEEPWVAGFTRTDAQGTFRAEVPPGHWDVYAVARAMPEFTDLPPGAGRYAPFASAEVNARQLRVLSGGDTRSPIPLAMGRATVGSVRTQLETGSSVDPLALTVGSPGRLAIEVTDSSGDALPAAIEVHYGDGFVHSAAVPQSLREALGLPTSQTRAARVWTGDGSVELPLVPGSYDVDIEHSWRHGRARRSNVTVPGSGLAQLQVALEEKIHRDGWMAMDSHLHAAPSSDGKLSMEDRLVTCAATGVEVPVHTDHDRHVDYRPLAAAMGLDERLLAVPGVEVSPLLRGHFNVFPVEARPGELANGGAEPWWILPENTEELFQRMRASAAPGAILQVNHGRSGMFEFANYDPTSGTPMQPDYWSWDFDAFELLNSTSARNWEPLRTDWFSFLNVGRRPVPTGVSDSHGRTNPCGYGHTDLFVGVDDPKDLSIELVQEAIRAGHAVVSGGVTLRATLQGDDPADSPVLPGETVVGSSATLRLRVLAPSWIVPKWVRLYRNGVVLREEELAGTKDGVTWYQASWPVESEIDAWYVVEVEGDQPMGGVWGGALPYAATNAFFLDVAGDGWEAPGFSPGDER